MLGVSSLDPRDARIAELEAQLAEKDRLIAELRAENQELRRRLAEHEARLGQNSQNSSRPPSSDGPGVKRRLRPPTGRKPGGQPGHRGAHRELLPQEEVDELVPLIPAACRHCNATLQGADPAPLRHQVTEVPPIKPHVTEYQCHALQCEQCGKVTRAELPVEVAGSSFGPRLTSLVALLSGAYRLSKRQVQSVLLALLGQDVSLGSVPGMERRVSAALEPLVEEARGHVRGAPVVHQDETGWRQGRRRAWLWVATSLTVSVFTISLSRGKDVSQQMLGKDFAGKLVSDRWRAYEWVHPLHRQVCWGHLLREFQGFVDRGGEAAFYGQELLDEMGVAFEWWHAFREGKLKRATLLRKMRPLMHRVEALLEEASESLTGKVAGTCREILKLRDSLWTYLYVEGVEPTNNDAERDLRHGVIWRKQSFGTHSEEGSRFVERLLTTVTTLKRQGRNVLEFLTNAYLAHLRGQAPPSLLPIPA